jgi:hypothetical protein
MPPLTARSINRPTKPPEVLAAACKPSVDRKRKTHEVVDLCSPAVLKLQSPFAAAAAVQPNGQPKPAKRARQSFEVKDEKRSKAKERHAKETADWIRKYSKAIKSFTFYFDSIDAHQQSELTRILHQLEAVSCCC